MPTKKPPQPVPLPIFPPIFQADAFVDSVGVNVHLHYDSPPTLYTADFPRVKQLLLDAKVRHIRDGLIPHPATWYLERHNELGRAGIRGVYVAGLNDPVIPQDWADRLFDVFDAYEAPNEPDCSGHPDWVNLTRELLCELRRVQRLPFQMIGPSLTSWGAYNDLGFIGKWADVGNLHNYLAGRHPGTGGWGDFGYGSLGYHRMLMGLMMGPDAPIMTTETGYGDDLSLPDGVPPEVAAMYLVRLLLFQFKAGIRRTYLYELADEGPPPFHQYGLVRGDGTPKPAYLAVHALLNLLADPGPAFTPTPIAYEVKGRTPDLLDLGLQKRDGTTFIALWQETSGWDVNSQTVIPVPRVAVELRVPGQAVRTGHEWQPDGTVSTWMGSLTDRQTVSVSDRLVVLEVR